MKSTLVSDSRLIRALRWFDFRNRRVGMYAYILNRVTAIGLVVYLYIHLAVLSLLAAGRSAWDPFITLARSPWFLMLDAILLAGLLIHSLNGLRVALVGFGIGVGAHKTLFVVLMAVAATAFVVGTLLIFFKG